MSQNTDDIRIGRAQPLITPWILAEELPLSDEHAATVASSRRSIENILSGKDKRVLAVVGPCSVHDPKALLEFATQFKAVCDPLSDAIFPVLRVYFEKPRTVVGWKGLISDPQSGRQLSHQQGAAPGTTGSARCSRTGASRRQ